MKPFERTETPFFSGQMVNEVENLTDQVMRRTNERISAEERAERSIAEAKTLLEAYGAERRNLSTSLKALQGTVAARLRVSTAKMKKMTEDFRELANVKDLFDQLQNAFLKIDKAASADEIAILQGHVTFALTELIKSSQWSKSLLDPFETFRRNALAADGPLIVRAALLSGHAGRTTSQKAFDDSWRVCLNQLANLRRIVDDHIVDATSALYYENNQLKEQLGSSETAGEATLLNTELATFAETIENSVENLFREHSRSGIEQTKTSIAASFSKARQAGKMIDETLKANGRDAERAILNSASETLSQVENVVVKRGGLIQTLEAAADARERSTEIGKRLRTIVQSQKESGEATIRIARDEQRRSVNTVNLVVRASTVLMPAIIVFVLGATLLFFGGIAKSIMRLVEELEKARDQAEAVNKAKSQFLANMSHEIRTPMNGVLGLLDLLKASNLPQKQRRYVDMALSSSVTLLNVINDILDFSKMEAGRMELVMEDFDLPRAVEETVNLFTEQSHTKGLELICYMRPETPIHVNGDATRLRQVLINLIGNAVKFTGEGEIVLEVSTAQTGDHFNLLRFEVRDTGVGIPPEAQQRIFNSFSQADASTTRRFGGTGLGLSIAKQLAQMMGGEIGVASQVGSGSTFWFTAKFGKAEHSGGVEKDGGLDGYYKRLKGFKVLVVDDNATNRKILEDMLSAWGLS